MDDIRDKIANFILFELGISKDKVDLICINTTIDGELESIEIDFKLNNS